ncbi:MAG: site-specific DNA-methyltransferase [Candidatus Neomicrothrix subdominans]
MSEGRLELVWPGKDKFLLVPKDADGRPVWVDRDHPAASEVRLADFTGAVGDVPEDPHAANLLFTGDSLDVLRILCEVPEYRSRYRGKVKLVYIDPPFNTGQAFEHYDDWMEHSTWLSFMRDRLLLIRDLLAPDGSVWVHLDDAEQHRMRLLMDEVFGAGAYAGTIIWRSSDNSNNDAQTLSLDHNTVFVYGANPGWRSRKLTPRADQVPHFKNPDGDPRGPWFDGNPLNSPNPRKDLMYDLVGPYGDIIPHPPKGWRWSRATLEDRLATGEIRFSDDGKAIRRRTYLADHPGLPPSSLWIDTQNLGASRSAKAELKRLFPGLSSSELFATPKPEAFIERVLNVGSNRGDIVLDCFAGSGTTAAVAHKMGRRWVTSEILSSTVDQFTLPRLSRVVAGEDPGGITKRVGWEGGGGCRTVEVGPSMYKDTPFGVLLAEWATNGRFARAVAGQLGFEFRPDTAPLCGVRGRMRLAVIDGAVGPEEVRQIVGALGERERVTIVAKSVLPEAESLLSEVSPGSRIRKAPRDLLTSGAKRMRRRTEPGARSTASSTEGSGS